MALTEYEQSYRKQGTNAAVIAAGATVALRWPTRLRIRMTEQEEYKYGACNTLRLVNKSSKRCRLHFTFGITPQKYEDIEANSIRNITVEDGINFYGFDVENLDTLNDIAAEEIQYAMAVVNQSK